MKLSKSQRRAIDSPCLLAAETMHPRYGTQRRDRTTVLTVNSGYE